MNVKIYYACLNIKAAHIFIEKKKETIKNNNKLF